jgi:branched-chain amino acid transport system ATP-binding protein
MAAMLEVRSLEKRFDGLRAVNELSFDVNEGEVLGIVGPNGAGKTTAINLISGTIAPTAGRVVYRGEDITGMAPHVLVQRGIVRTFQATTVYRTRTVFENVWRGAFLQNFPGFWSAFLSTKAAHERRAQCEIWVKEVLGWLNLTAVADLQAGSLPYGIQKTLGLAIAVAARPTLIMLDEPVAGLSAEESERVREAILNIKKRGITIITIDHNMRFMSGLCDRILVMHHGQELAIGAPREVLSNPAVVEAYLGKGYVAA